MCFVLLLNYSTNKKILHIIHTRKVIYAFDIVVITFGYVIFVDLAYRRRRTTVCYCRAYDLFVGVQYVFGHMFRFTLSYRLDISIGGGFHLEHSVECSPTARVRDTVLERLRAPTRALRPIVRHRGKLARTVQRPS